MIFHSAEEFFTYTKHNKTDIYLLELKRLDAVPLPATQRLRAEMDELTARKAALQSEHRKAQREERQYDTLRQNVEALLEKPREAEPQRQRNNELE